MKKFLVTLIILFWSTSLFASMKFLFATKLVCDESQLVTIGKDAQGLNILSVRDIGQLYLAFNKTKVWAVWDPINQKFEEEHKVITFVKNKIVTEWYVDGEYSPGISLNRVSGEGYHRGNNLSNCKKVDKFPVKNIKQKF